MQTEFQNLCMLLWLRELRQCDYTKFIANSYLKEEKKEQNCYNLPLLEEQE